MTEIIIRSEVQRATVNAMLDKLDLKYPWRVTVVRFVKRRSLPANALLHKWFSVIADEMGDDDESVKDTLKQMFAPKVSHENKITGEIAMRPMRTRDMDTAQMSAFMTKVQGWAWSFAAIGLPAPEDAHDRH